MKKIFLFIVMSAVVFLGGCGKAEQQYASENQPDEKKTVNFLTGIEADTDIYTRPVAVTVNNLEASLPQYGISEADIIMEFPVEGGITRLMALYGDYRRVPSVCSVRSCRYYFPIFAKGFDAVYFCFGSNETLATPTLERLGADYIDGNKESDSLVFERDSERLESYSSEHTVYLKGRNMEQIFEKYGFSAERDESLGEAAFDFADEVISLETPCTELTAEFSSSYFSDFYFDAEIEEYLKSHNGQPHSDLKSTEQLSFTNVILLETEIFLYNGTSLVEFDWHGGYGYYATMGTVRKIMWQKESEAAPLRFFDTEGNPLELNRGKSYIGVGAQVLI
ncbi:MAG: DUF3048 domain-containing protein [Clostridia bacterium]|nr:DUF3048 domain-containing protein [Clostridia bacterium]